MFRFLVRQTIEERIHQMLKTYHQQYQDIEKGGHSTEENLLTIQVPKLSSQLKVEFEG